MQKIRVPVNNFSFGEVSESTLMRTDTPIYQSSAQRIENMVILSEGGVKRRPGLNRIYDFSITRDTTKTFQSRLVPFIFDAEERYIVSIENAQLRVFIIDPTTGALSLTSTITQDTNAAALPFDDDYIHEYTYAHYGDVLFIAHPLFMPRQLVRTSLTTFEVTPMTFDERNDSALTYQPYSVFHASDVTLSASATTGTGITLTTSEDYFDTTSPNSLHEGVILRYHDTEVQITSVTNATTATADINGTLRQRLEILNPFRTIDGDATVEVTHINHGFAGGESITFEEASAVGGINAASLNGARTVGTIIDENTYTFEAGATANTAEDGGGYVKVVTSAATTVWSEQSFSALRGYPQALAFHENRLVLAASIAQPDALWFSKTGSFYNFDVGTAADADSINLVAANSDVHDIRYLRSSRDLQVFSASSELYVPTYLNQAITPSNAQIRTQTPYGTEFVEPHSLDGATLFIQRGGKVAREFIYTDQEDAYSSVAVSTIASHLLGDATSQTVCHGAFDTPESYAIFATSSSKLVLFSSNRAEKRAGWCRFTCSGDFYDVIAIDDRLFASAWIDTGSGKELILGEFDYDYSLDCSKIYTLSSGIATVTGDFTDGTEVAVVKDNEYLGLFTVASGQVDVSALYTTGDVEIGFAFTATLTSNPMDATISNGPRTGDYRGLSTVVLDLVGTYDAKVNTRPTLISSSFTGKKEVRLLGFDRDPQVSITQAKPLPIQVNGFVAEVII